MCLCAELILYDMLSCLFDMMCYIKSHTKSLIHVFPWIAVPAGDAPSYCDYFTNALRRAKQGRVAACTNLLPYYIVARRDHMQSYWRGPCPPARHCPDRTLCSRLQSPAISCNLCLPTDRKTWVTPLPPKRSRNQPYVCVQADHGFVMETIG